MFQIGSVTEPVLPDWCGLRRVVGIVVGLPVVVFAVGGFQALPRDSMARHRIAGGW